MKTTKESTNIIQFQKREKMNESIAKITKIVIGVLLFKIAITGYRTFDLFTTDATVSVTCPKTDDLDGPYTMKRVREFDQNNFDIWFKSFVRQFMQNAFPRNSKIAKKAYEKARSLSCGSISYQFDEYIKGIDDITKIMDDGSYYRYYPDKTDTVKISKSKDDDLWRVSFEGFLLRHTLGGQTKSYSPKFVLELEQTERTNSNPFGVCVKDFKITELKNALSGDIRDIQL